jgi:hypothetical protein
MRVGTTSKVMEVDRPYGEFMTSTALVRNILDSNSYIFGEAWAHDFA